MSVSQKNTEIALKQFINEVVSKARTNLARKGKNATGNLSKSISGDYKVSPNSFEISFSMEDYGTFQDLGVKGARSSNKAPNSPYKFGTGTAPKGMFKTAINAWVIRKGIAPRTNGKFANRSQMLFNIRRSIFNTGIRPSLFFTNAFDVGFKGLDNRILEAYGLDAESFLKYSLENNGKKA
jgi:hypothetical protein